MSADSALPVNSDVSIPRFELTFRATRAGGPGGQHVNTSSTRVELLWNVDRSRAISEQQRQRLRDKLAGRVDAQGNVRVVASAFRSQLRNREDAEHRLAALVRRALTVPKARKKTRPSRSAVESRLRTKRELSEKKKERRVQDLD
ncbi:MAG TPA: alternative ribosome rescue aminoacyl-tRNA hydrolase ArfB [Gemmatimonadaceae bacterium]